MAYFGHCWPSAECPSPPLLARRNTPFRAYQFMVPRVWHVSELPGALKLGGERFGDPPKAVSEGVT